MKTVIKRNIKIPFIITFLIEFIFTQTTKGKQQRRD